ncbi:hypothetical protein [Bacteroides sp.]|uniref:hypothetical protein n=1 Tax=Bacteroides sp. TaxID=29523 RepID=UPI002638F5FF|nr:hypothetical protein [Bacteroides sp.]MDD3039727.1 hypothetical protein [Bacteroides sp.]
MAQIGMNEVENYGSGGSNFFALKNDKDVAQVRFMYDTSADLSGYALHEIEVDGKRRYVNCLRTYNEPIDNCPLCAAKSKIQVKFFVQVYDIKDQIVRVWERGRGFGQWISGLFTRYNPLVGAVIEIERNGKAGDKNTTYQPFPISVDDTKLEDLPETVNPLGSIILDKTFDELEFYVKSGFFPVEGQQRGATNTAGDTPRRRAVPAEDETPRTRRQAF